jgi:hypothetical protein
MLLGPAFSLAKVHAFLRPARAFAAVVVKVEAWKGKHPVRDPQEKIQKQKFFHA